MKTLENTYCRPTTEEELNLLKAGKAYINLPICMNSNKKLAVYSDSNRTEIPVQHFIDLLEDGICAWRLKEIGFVNKYDFDYVYAIDNRTDLYITPNYNFIRSRYNGDEVDIPVNIKTFTDLLTLIRFLK